MAPAPTTAQQRTAAVHAAIATRLSPELAALLLPIADGMAPAPSMLPPLPWPELAAALPDLLPVAERKRQGAWFTPPALAEPTARRALAPLLATPGPLRILDPAVGGGAFLQAAFRELRRAGRSADTALASLHGIDLDPAAVALATLAVWAVAERPAADLPALAARIRCGDGLALGDDNTFDAVLTNPPWETLQGRPGATAHAAALRQRFHHQGRGKTYTYRLFVERAVHLLRPGGRFGLVVPASLWFDRDAAPLRRHLLDDCTWEWLFGFENRRRVFPIDSRWRFAALVGERGGPTRAVRVAFGHSDLCSWADPQPPHTEYPREQLTTLSPHAATFVEFDDPRDLAWLRHLHEHGTPLLGGASGWQWRQGDFNMTGDRNRFVPRAAAEADGWRRGDDGRWRHPHHASERLPLLQGAMVHDLQPLAAVHTGGAGFATRWAPSASGDDLRPAYLVPASAAPPDHGARVVLRTLTNATNQRTAIACLLPALPCGNSLGVLTPADPATPLQHRAALAAVLSSLPFDWALRLRLSGQNLNGFVLHDCVVPRLSAAMTTALAAAAVRLCGSASFTAGLWQAANAAGWCPDPPATNAAERAALHTRIDVLVGQAWGLDAAAVAWMVRGCDDLTPRHPRGFWRLDRQLPPAQRRPNRWLAAGDGTGRDRLPQR